MRRGKRLHRWPAPPADSRPAGSPLSGCDRSNCTGQRQVPRTHAIFAFMRLNFLSAITASACTDASVHDSQVLDAVLRYEATDGKEVWADSAYRSDGQEQSLKGSQHESQIHERAYRNKPLTEAQELSNTEKSRVRARVEHVFGAMENDLGGIFLRSIGAARAKVGVGLMNLTYNLKRIETLMRLKVFDFDRIGAPVVRATA